MRPEDCYFLKTPRRHREQTRDTAGGRRGWELVERAFKCVQDRVGDTQLVRMRRAALGAQTRVGARTAERAGAGAGRSGGVVQEGGDTRAPVAGIHVGEGRSQHKAVKQLSSN